MSAQDLENFANQSSVTRLHCPPHRGPCPAVKICAISDKQHPACGECGLFAATNLPAGRHVIDYVGQVFDDCHVSDSSNYVLRLCPGLSLDAERQGNEARFINDYRGVRGKPNCKFELYSDSSCQGAVRMGVWTLEPVRKGEELLVSYGRYWWKARMSGTQEEGEELQQQEGPDRDTQMDADQLLQQPTSQEQGQPCAALCDPAVHRDKHRHHRKYVPEPSQKQACTAAVESQQHRDSRCQKGSRQKGLD